MVLAHIPRCQHTKDDGSRCGSPALRGRKLCYFHDRQRRTSPHRQPRRTAAFCRRADFFNVRTADDIVRSLNQVMNAIIHGQLFPKEAGSILFALQTATNIVESQRLGRPWLQPWRSAKREPLEVSRGAAPFPAGEGAFTTRADRRPRTVAEIFDMFPGCDDLRAMLTPEDIAELERSTMSSW